ncbi:MAG: hypothetical protein P4M10_02665 [Verrucomicrobiae bacterium]|nr:hypothetical protein [Verrucomicrobiae bacterium]
MEGSTAENGQTFDRHIMTSELMRLQKILNREDVLPAVAYRRNVVIYELVCYINCLIGCVLSGRTDSMSAFIRRSGEFMDKHPAEGYERYYSAARGYLAEVKHAFKVGEEL